MNISFKKFVGCAVLLTCSFLVFHEEAFGREFGTNQLNPEIETPATFCGHETIALIIDSLLVSQVRESLNQFEADLCNDGYNIIENSTEFANPYELRNYLRQLLEHPDIDLAGTILIGEIPYAYQWIELIFSNPDLAPLEEEVISYQYYADLNGGFSKTPGYESPGEHEFSFDVHDGDVDWEIWVGVLPYYKGSLEMTIEALKRYFAKNHAFRNGVLRRPDAFLQISELLTDVQFLRSGPYVWEPYATLDNARLYAGDVSDGYADLQTGMAEITVVGAHGYWGASGQLSIYDVESSPVKTILFWSSGCAIGNLDYDDNFLTSILYSETSEVLVAKGTTNNSGGMGTNENGFYGRNVATALSKGASLGNSILEHVNVPLIYPWSNSREFHTGTIVILGDPTLKFELTRAFPINSLQELYVGILGRAADRPGLDYWQDQIYAGIFTLENTRAAFTHPGQAEYTEIYGGLTNSQLVTAIYENFLERAPDNLGFLYWVAELDNGRVNPNQMINAIINAVQDINATGEQSTKDFACLDNKIEVAMYFTEETKEYLFDEAYREMARAVVADVTDDPETLTQAKAMIDEYVGN